MRVAILGPAGTYSDEAATKRFQQFRAVFCSSLEEVVENVGSGRCEYAVLPVENSTNGVVDLAIKALVNSPTRRNIEITDEVKVLIRHQLYTHATSLSTIDTVYSHPQVWGQAQKWLRLHLPNARLIDVDSSSHAVSRVLHSRSVHEAAIGGPNSSSSAPLVANCCDNQENTTRFLVLHNSVPEAGEIYGPARVHLILPNTTIGQAAQELAGVGDLLFTSAVAATPNWKYNVYIDLALKNRARLELQRDWQLLGKEGM